MYICMYCTSLYGTYSAHMYTVLYILTYTVYTDTRTCVLGIALGFML